LVKLRSYRAKLARNACRINFQRTPIEKENAMAFDPFADEPRKIVSTHEIGQDLSMLSVDELDERVAVLEREIARLREAKASKEDSLAAASAFFNLGQG
jgi:uncharacterized small protein (DUF1192 family)